MCIYNSPLAHHISFMDRYPINFGMLSIEINMLIKRHKFIIYHFYINFLHKIIGLHFFYCLRDSWPPLLLPLPSLGSQKLLVLLCTAEPHMTPPSPHLWLDRQELLPVGGRPSHRHPQRCLSHTPFSSVQSHSYTHVGFCHSGSVKS